MVGNAFAQVHHICNRMPSDLGRSPSGAMTERSTRPASQAAPAASQPAKSRRSSQVRRPSIKLAKNLMLAVCLPDVEADDGRARAHAPAMCCAVVQTVRAGDSRDSTARGAGSRASTAAGIRSAAVAAKRWS